MPSPVSGRAVPNRALQFLGCGSRPRMCGGSDLASPLWGPAQSARIVAARRFTDPTLAGRSGRCPHSLITPRRQNEIHPKLGDRTGSVLGRTSTGNNASPSHGTREKSDLIWRTRRTHIDIVLDKWRRRVSKTWDYRVDSSGAGSKAGAPRFTHSIIRSAPTIVSSNRLSSNTTKSVDRVTVLRRRITWGIVCSIA